MAEGYDTSDASTVKKRRTKAKIAQDEIQAYWHETLDTYAGRAVFWNILEMCGMYRDCPPESASEMAHFLGRRNIGLKIDATLLTIDETLYMTIRSEAIARQKKWSL